MVVVKAQRRTLLKSFRPMKIVWLAAAVCDVIPSIGFVSLFYSETGCILSELYYVT
jgi:hypothetical protein